MANALQVTKATMTHTLNVLEKHGLVEILSNPEDYRSKLVYITKQGRQFQQKAIFALAPTLEKIGNECGIPELSASIPLLEKIRNYMDKERNL
jgi:DNA-binding MarR family transcriptional regulator